ncbi:MAG TPA: FAD-dependent monooxygenase [Candidatus Kapabacteria bacterium]|nr:FAD-dependent monooxygenase [Candidatus Kapabacteria bacterium]
MGFSILEVNLRTDYATEDLVVAIQNKLNIKEFNYEILKQSLDGRSANDIHWQIRLGVSSDELKSGVAPEVEQLDIPNNKHKAKKVVIVGSGPAGIFASSILITAGYQVTLIEQGAEVYQRIKDVKHFEKTSELNERSNYAFGEGGAGTFSDGKLTSRTKSIGKERDYIIDKFIALGGPEEIKYFSKPHVGSNLLTKIVKNFRKELIDKGVEITFDNKMTSIYKQGTKITAIETEKGKITADYFIVATGHSAYEVFQSLVNIGVKFHLKDFAIGSRVEHPQELINKSKWRTESLPGVKSADYALTFSIPSKMSAYSFCMCPGGMVVSAPPYKGLNIVNGMSNYKRNYPFANSALVAGVNIQKLTGKNLDALQALDWLMNLERKFYDFTGSYKAPAVKVSDFMSKKITNTFGTTSYPFELVSAEYRELFPQIVIESIFNGIKEFSTKIRGFEEGVMMGLESRTSSPIQVERDNIKVAGFDNLYFAGEGSGLSGGIVSSAADGIKCAMDIANNDR